jgi:hypothetical protein
MTVAELIAALKEHQPDAEVFVEADGGLGSTKSVYLDAGTDLTIEIGQASARELMAPGTLVRFSDTFKASCPEGLRENMAEFSDCVGVLLGPMFTDDPCVVDVRWQPSGLRYGYDVSFLTVAASVRD